MCNVVGVSFSRNLEEACLSLLSAAVCGPEPTPAASASTGLEVISSFALPTSDLTGSPALLSIALADRFRPWCARSKELSGIFSTPRTSGFDIVLLTSTIHVEEAEHWNHTYPRWKLSLKLVLECLARLRIRGQRSASRA